MRAPNKTAFWERVKTLLKARKIPQNELAVLIGLKYSTLKFWICYGYSPDIDTACDIAELLGVTVEYLVRGIEAKRGKRPAAK